MAGIYIHIPFCKKRCIYCDFYSTTSVELKDEYIDAVEKEISDRRNYAGNEEISTIYFGGGTPSLLKPEETERIITKIKSTFRISENPEITIEANPDDLTDGFLTELKKTEVNRISIGIQTFNDKRLEFLNRRHNSQQAVSAVKRCQDYGYDNISMDLIYGFPEESISEWETDIDKAISLNVQHISAYHLIYEEGTVLTGLVHEGKINELDEEQSIEQFGLLISKLKNAGFVHYEISNFCKPGKESRHNTSYWKNIKYIGIGPSAHSYNGKSRQWNIADLSGYMECVKTGKQFFETETIDLHTGYNDYILTAMRTMWGADTLYIKEHFGNTLLEYFLKNIRKYTDSGDVQANGSRYTIKESGIFISDGIMSDLMWVG